MQKRSKRRNINEDQRKENNTFCLSMFPIKYVLKKISKFALRVYEGRAE